MQPSLRRRLALLSATLAGSALLGFSAISYGSLREAKLARFKAQLPRELRQAGRLLRSGNPQFPDDRFASNLWSQYEAEVSRALGTELALRALRPDGSVIYQSPAWSDTSLLPVLPSPPPPPPAFNRPPRPPGAPPERPDRLLRELPEPELRIQRLRGETWGMGALFLPVASGNLAQVAFAVRLAAFDSEMRAIRNLYALTLPLLLLAIAGSAWWLAGQALQPVQQLSQTLRGVTVADLDQRVTIPHPDVELVGLIDAFNAMLARLERSFKQASRFSGDAAHELKTPLAILQGELERALQDVETGSPLQQRLARLLEEVSRLSSIVRKLLLLSLADAGKMNLQRQPVDLSALLEEALVDLDLLAPDLPVQAEIQPGLMVQGDRDLLAQVVQNLLSNAIKYNRPQGWIRLQARRSPLSPRESEQNWLLLHISNASLDLTADERERIFDRFQRGDRARTRRPEGTGLGLSLAREIARAHGGDLRLEPAVPGETTLLLALPLASDRQAPLPRARIGSDRRP